MTSSLQSCGLSRHYNHAPCLFELLQFYQWNSLNTIFNWKLFPHWNSNVMNYPSKLAATRTPTIMIKVELTILKLLYSNYIVEHFKNMQFHYDVWIGMCFRYIIKNTLIDNSREAVAFFIYRTCYPYIFVSVVTVLL